MPIVHSQTNPEGTDAQGNRVPVPPDQGLIFAGPRLPCIVGVSSAVSQTMLEAGSAPPVTENGFALIDTGATATGIDRAVAQRLGLPTVNTIPLGSVAGANEHPVHPVMLFFPGLQAPFDAFAVGVDLEIQGLIALIGRDLLSRCTLHYNGPRGEFTLAT